MRGKLNVSPLLAEHLRLPRRKPFSILRAGKPSVEFAPFYIPECSHGTNLDLG